MKSLLKHITPVFLFLGLVSCDVASELLTTNHFEPFKDINPFVLIIDDVAWVNVPNKEVKIDEYTSAALSKDNSEEFFRKLSVNTQYRNDVAAHYKTYLDENVPNINSITYNIELVKYQRRAMALAKIEIYTRGNIAEKGFNSLFSSYLSGEENGKLTSSIFINKVFNNDDPKLNLQPVDKEELTGYLSAGRAFELLGSTIVDKDNPTSPTIKSNDGVIILISSMINRVVELSSDNFIDEDAVLSALESGIAGGAFSSDLIFPQDNTDISISMLENYLGPGGALTYTASGFDLPSVTVLGGNL